MVMTGNVSKDAQRLLFVAGWVALEGEDEMYAAMAGRRGGVLEVYDADTGTRLANHSLSSVPIFDGMAAAGGKLFMSHRNGTIECLGAGQAITGRSP